MAFARRKPSDANAPPRRTSSLRVASTTSARGRTPSASLKDTNDKEQSALDVIAETCPKKESILRPTKPANPVTRKKSTLSLRNNEPSDVIHSAAAVQRRIVSGPSHPAVQETRAKPRPISMTLIPSPSPTRTSSLHTRKDKYGALTEDSHRRSASTRSVSTTADNQSNSDMKTTDTARGIIPPRTASHSSTRTAPAERKLPVNVTRALIPQRTTSQPPPITTKPEITDEDPPAESPLPLKAIRAQKSSREFITNQKSLKKESTMLDIPNSHSGVHKKQSSRELLQSLTRSTTTKPTLRSESRTAGTVPSSPPRTTSHRRQPSKEVRDAITTNGSTPPRNAVHKKQSSRDLRASSRLQSHPKPAPPPLKTKLSKDLSARPSRETLGKPNAVRKQLSKELSPSPSAQSSPNAKMKSSSTIFFDSPPDQIRLLQLLHLIPLSSANLSTYESSAHKTLSSRYRALQSRFEAIQKLDHAQCLVDELATLKSWSDGQIRTLATLLIDWESLSTDLRNFNRRLSATLKPVNKSVIEEKGAFLGRDAINSRSSVFTTS